METFLVGADLTTVQTTIEALERETSVLHVPIEDGGSLPVFREPRGTFVLAFTREEWLNDFLAEDADLFPSASSASLNAYEAFNRADAQGAEFVRINPGQFLDLLIYSDDCCQYHEPADLELAIRDWIREVR